MTRKEAGELVAIAMKAFTVLGQMPAFLGPQYARDFADSLDYARSVLPGFEAEAFSTSYAAYLRACADRDEAAERVNG